MTETPGFIRIVVDAESKQILGAAIPGIEGDEAIHRILDVMYAKLPYTVPQLVGHTHPAVLGGAEAAVSPSQDSSSMPRSCRSSINSSSSSRVNGFRAQWRT